MHARFLSGLLMLSSIVWLSGCKQTQVRRGLPGTSKTHSYQQLPGATPYLSYRPPSQRKKPKARKVALNSVRSTTSAKQSIPQTPPPTRRSGRSSLLLPPTDRQLRRYVRRAPASRHVRRLRQKVVRWAQRSLGRRWMRCGRGFRLRRDCSGWVRCLYSKLQLDLQRHPHVKWGNGVYLMYHYVKTYGTFHKRKRPDPGDLVFWHYTYDKNRNGVLDDRWTHIGVVEKVDRDGRISILHFSKKVKRTYMNLVRPRATWERRVRRGYRRHRRRCIQAGNRYNRCRRYYSRRRCRYRWRRKRSYCTRARKYSRRTQNSVLVSRRRGRIHGRRTVQVFAGFGTILQSPLPPHLQPWRSLPVSWRVRSLSQVASAR